jgi:hypothetical protein
MRARRPGRCVCFDAYKEAEQWFSFDGRRWEKDIGGYVTAELCKEFVTAFGEYVSNCCADDSEFVKYAAKLSSHYRPAKGYSPTLALSRRCQCRTSTRTSSS